MGNLTAKIRKNRKSKGATCTRFCPEENFDEHLESELFKNDATERDHQWDSCRKNPSHEKFISAKDFQDICLPKLNDFRGRELLRSCIDLTVRLIVHYTSTERPTVRQSDNLRTGTGFIRLVFPPEFNRYCSCVKCDGEIKKKTWRFHVRTAHHILRSLEEAKNTQVDLFLDDESCERDGRMKSVWGLEMVERDPDRDMCTIECVTCDEDVGERIGAAWSRLIDDDEDTVIDLNLCGLDLLLPPSDRVDLNALIVSHPHGKPKKITVGEMREDKYRPVTYIIATCRGSSGAPVFRFGHNRHRFLDLFFPPVHSGRYIELSPEREVQLNYGFSSW